MKIVGIIDSFEELKNGCFFVRVHTPFCELRRRGHDTTYEILSGHKFDELKKADLVVFSRIYNSDAFRLVWRLKANGVKVAYEVDDDVWNIPKANMAHDTFEVKKLDVQGFLKEADITTTTNENLKGLLSEFSTHVEVVPNALNLDMFKERPHTSKRIKIGWTGGMNHLEDLEMLPEVIEELQKKYDFDFIIQGLTSSPFEADAYSYNLMLYHNVLEEKKVVYYKRILDLYTKFAKIKNFQHVPFYPPEMYPKVLSNIDLDIGLIPLTGNKFDRSKSIIKFLEYTSVGTAVLASDELPYKGVVPYTTKNKRKYWVKKLEELIVNKQLREDLVKEQKKICFPKYDIKTVGEKWEQVYKNIINNGKNIQQNK